jgi:hypothetical protein
MTIEERRIARDVLLVREQGEASGHTIDKVTFDLQ